MAQVYEEVLQGELLKIIQSGQFYDSIQGIEEIDRLNERDYDEDLFPKFTIDYLLRQKAYRSAKFILQSLKEGFYNNKWKQYSERFFTERRIFNAGFSTS